jgi:hypothetical protein
MVPAEVLRQEQQYKQQMEIAERAFGKAIKSKRIW